MRLHADVQGNGPALVLLHGFTGSTATWFPHRASLAPRFRVIAIDLPGHGLSPIPSDSACGRLDRLAHDLVAVLDRFGIPKAHWLGYSLGGRAALHVALAHPQRVDRLVVEGASAGIEDPLERAARAATDAALADSIERDGIEVFVDCWMVQPLFGSQARLGPDVLARERARRLTASPAGLAAALRAMSVGTQASLWPRLGDLAVPTLLIVGAEDQRYREQAADMAARIPHATVAVVPNAGHAVHLENPVAFWAAVEAFLGAAPPAA